ncbi:MAG: histidinol-phosphatase [Candidatus Aminicenantes bacterium]|nr:histidinol-phosphatase [Candidatus Aminicenantes bacterium]
MKNIFFRKRLLTVVVMFIVALAFSFQVDGWAWVRSEVKIPDIPGYLTLKCDFHMHSVFSDGRVWPTLRCDEAWREGLDVFSITEHIENRYHSYDDDIKIDLNRSHQVTLPGAEALGLLLIKGGEITREMPPGHFNAIFLKDVNALKKEEFKDSVKEAVSQGAFVFWNHPGWRGQQKDGVSRWYDIHEYLYKKKHLHGVEVANGPEYYPRVHRWALEKKLTLVGNSDAHDPLSMSHDFHKGEHRTMTLVFAKERTEAAVKEALFARRTAVYQGDTLIGEHRYLEAIFNNSVEILNPEVTIKGRRSAYIQVRNKSDVTYELHLSGGKMEHITVPYKITLYGDKTVLLRVRGTDRKMSGKKEISLSYVVKNLLVAPKKSLPITFDIKVHFSPSK